MDATLKESFSYVHFQNQIITLSEINYHVHLIGCIYMVYSWLFNMVQSVMKRIITAIINVSSGG